MRIVLVLGSSTGGIGAHVRDLAGFLIREGHQVVVAGPAATDEQFGFSGGAGAAVPSARRGRAVRFVPVAIGPAPDPAHDLTAVRTLRRLTRDADVVHAHGVRAGSLTRLALPHASGAPRSVVTLHNAMLATGGKAKLLGVLERMAVRRADVVLGASADLVARARELGARRAELGPVPAPPLRPATRSRPQVRAELGLDRNRPLLLAVGRLAPQKAYPVLLDALARVESTTKPTLLIAGDGPLRAELQAKIDRLGVDAHLLGRREDIADLLAAADVFVLCSDWEARALVVQEAMRAGLPVLATKVGGIPELVGSAAVLVPPGEPGAFARALGTILGDAEKQGRLRKAALAQAATWPSSEAALALVLACYSD
ncbi:MAG TPA: glycosyltransferase family 4 protein [Actinocrinis sp.]|nr:glycosyltransferase family 4 protein [Actinocrinis sp.]